MIAPLILLYVVIGVITSAWLGRGTNMGEFSLGLVFVFWPLIFLMMTLIFIGVFIRWVANLTEKK